jgi:hypothetical protein
MSFKEKFPTLVGKFGNGYKKKYHIAEIRRSCIDKAKIEEYLRERLLE